MFSNESYFRLSQIASSPMAFELEFSAASPEGKQHAKEVLEKWKAKGSTDPKIPSSLRGMDIINRLYETLN